LAVQKPKHHDRSLHRPASRVIFCVATTLLTFVAVSVYAGEPIITLSPDPLSEVRPALSLTQWASFSDSLYLYRQGDPSEAGSINTEEADLFLPAGHDEAQTNALQGESFLMVRSNLRPSKPVTVDAGYRQIWDDKSMLQKICADYQDPGYAYVSASFSF
jgi:hypothetical protein